MKLMNRIHLIGMLMKAELKTKGDRQYYILRVFTSTTSKDAKGFNIDVFVSSKFEYDKLPQKTPIYVNGQLNISVNKQDKGKPYMNISIYADEVFILSSKTSITKSTESNKNPVVVPDDDNVISMDDDKPPF